ncbi:hypothetical protein ACFFX0_16645 [Citricoccus parietis]|uniref:Uncharacterized protein n=1 Tax=Citricoccus parietis TaxID=592307 RepID=A0ABV5G1D3_9MICC
MSTWWRSFSGPDPCSSRAVSAGCDIRQDRRRASQTAPLAWEDQPNGEDPCGSSSPRTPPWTAGSRCWTTGSTRPTRTRRWPRR